MSSEFAVKMLCQVRHRNVYQRPSWPELREVRDSFVSLGFSIVDQQDLYYNPTRRLEFTVMHVRESALTMWLMKYQDQFGPIVVQLTDPD